MRDDDPSTRVPPDAVLAVFSSANGDGEPLTALEVASELGCPEAVARERLAALVEAGDLRTKRISDGERVWWPAGSDGSATAPWGVQRLQDGPDEVVERLLETSPVGISVVEAGGAISYANGRMAEILGRPRSEVVDMTHDDPDWDIYSPDGRRIPSQDHPVTRVFETGEPIFGFEHRIEVPGGDSKWLSSNCAPVRQDGEVCRVVVAVDDITELKRNERRLERKKEELTRFDRVNSVIRAAVGAVVDAESADDLERAVCGALAGADPYLFSVVGHFSSSYEEFTARNSAGVGQEYIRAVVDDPDGPPIDQGIGATAARTGEIQVVQDVEGLSSDQWQEPARSHGFHSYASIPLVYEDASYGVLAVFAREPQAFDERERVVLSELGDVVAHGLYVATRESELRQDQAVELTFTSQALTAPFREAGLADLQVRADSIVHLGENRHLQYYTVRNASPREYLDVVSEYPWVEDARLVATDDESFRVEMVTGTDTVMSILDDYGGSVESIVIDDGAVTVTGRVPRSSDLDEVTAAIEAIDAGFELVDRSLVQTPRSLRHVIETALTDRQTTVLRMAHSAGYFERPRKSTGEELADRLGVTPTTFHRHLRNAEARTFQQLYDGNGEGTS